MPLHLQYRPKNFDTFIGNVDMISSLKAVVERQDDLPHAWLLVGPMGCGKTTLARIISSNYLGCPAEPTNPDYNEINCGSHGKIETVREIEKDARYAPVKSANRVWVLDEVHMLGSGGASEKNPAQNALLKILEDYPKRGHLILCTTDPQRLIGTIHSRCTTFRVNPLNEKEMKTLINQVLKEEEFANNFPPAAIEAIIEASEGHPRDALKILDQVIDLEESAMLGAIQGYDTIETEVKELCQALLKKSSWVFVSAIITKLKKNGEDCEKVRRAIIGYMTVVMLNSKPSRNEESGSILFRCKDVYECFKNPTYNNGWAEVISAAYEATII